MWWTKRPLIVYFATVFAWAGLVGTSYVHDLGIHARQAEGIAWARARMLFDIVETTRLWNARHGGVYAPVTVDTQPNPYLKVPDRDFEALGKKFTMLNPAYMTRQIAELVQQRQGTLFHITSLRPIRPENKADRWETIALQRFEEGDREVIERLDAENPPVFRYMSSLTVKPACMKCHEQQGYKVGDIRGGISVTIPVAAVTAEMEPQRRQSLIQHLIFFLVAAGGTLLFISRLRANWLALETVRAQQEAIIQARTAELRRSNQELENFAYVASHDLQEPLRMVTSYTQLLARRYQGKLDTDADEFIGFVIDGTSRMQAMIRDLLDYSRVDRVTVTFEPVALEEVLDVAMENLKVAIQEADAEIERDTLPMVGGHGLLLVRMLQNLIGNAIKYHHPDRPPVIRILAERDGDRWRIGVRDNGRGIPEAAFERVFQIFQRLQPRSQAAGTGIGLAVCRRIAEHHGGHIWVESKEGEGSTFWFTVPAA